MWDMGNGDNSRKKLKKLEITCSYCNGERTKDNEPCPSCWGTGTETVWDGNELEDK